MRTMNLIFTLTLATILCSCGCEPDDEPMPDQACSDRDAGAGCDGGPDMASTDK